jgi:sugar phosphate isomerase/epimerase
MITRRKFLTQTSALLAGSLMLPGLAKAKSPGYKMGLQLFSIRDALANDLVGALKTVASWGYQDLETYGFGFEDITYYKMKAIDFKRVLDDLQLTTTSGHYDLFRYLNKTEDDLKRYVDQCIEGAHAVGHHYITWPWLDPDSRSIDKFKLLAQRLNLVGEQVKKSGLGFAYHNHDFEFIDHNGQNGYNIIMNETDFSLVKLQIDLYWAIHSSKLTPAELFNKQPGRFVMWHIKDMHKQSRDYTELGNGSIDYTTILPEASKAGLQYYFLEQGGNFAKSSMESMRDSAKFFKENLERYL